MPDIDEVDRRNEAKGVVPPGDDVVSVPPKLDKDPPEGRFCDLVLTGGVASGVVYPWAIVELARAYRFKNIGGTSVGAMAASLAAAAEYGRRTGARDPFETMRRVPAALGHTVEGGRTRMVSLFQPNPKGKRLLELLVRYGQGHDYCESPPADGEQGILQQAGLGTGPGLLRRTARAIGQVFAVYGGPAVLGASAMTLLAVLLWESVEQWLPVAWVRAIFLFVLVGLAATATLVTAILSDLRWGVIDNELGLCKGGTLEGPDLPGLCEWLHNGIQRSAGLKPKDSPLTFRQLWNAPSRPGGPYGNVDETSPVEQRAINLQMITTSLTHERPYRLPMVDRTTDLLFDPADMVGYFPQVVCDALNRHSVPFEGTRDAPRVPGSTVERLRRLPGADLPIVVAARLSLSYPFLFSTVRLWAIDEEAPEGKRVPRPCHFTDGGAASNFPIHLFDAALPRWPTFGMWLDRRKPYYYPPHTDGPRNDVWLPRFGLGGSEEGWNRFHPEARPGPAARTTACEHFALFMRFASAIGGAAFNWQDRAAMQLPHVRDRVARLFLRPGEGALHIAMSREQILRMADLYGTAAGRLFVERFADAGGNPSQAWLDQRRVRLEMLLEGLRERLTGLSLSIAWESSSMPLNDAVRSAVADGGDTGRGDGAQPAQDDLSKVLAQLTELERLVGTADLPPSRYQPLPELRLRAPL